MISNSGSDERGAYKGGQAGDQTGREWQIRSWYNRPWTCVLRHPDKNVGIMLSNLSIKSAKNDKIGYDQNQRGTYWTELKKANYDPSAIKTACEADCSAGVIANTKAVGHLIGDEKLQKISATYTGNMKSGLKSAGFTVLTAKKYLTGESELQIGDILLNESHHTAVYVGDGKIINLDAPDQKKPAKKDPAPAVKSTHKAKESAQLFDKAISGSYKTTGNLNMRHGAGTGKQLMVTLPKGTKCQCYGYYSKSAGTKWFYVVAVVNGVEYTGFCSSAFLKK